MLCSDITTFNRNSIFCWQYNVNNIKLDQSIIQLEQSSSWTTSRRYCDCCVCCAYLRNSGWWSPALWVVCARFSGRGRSLSTLWWFFLCQKRVKVRVRNFSWSVFFWKSLTSGNVLEFPAISWNSWWKITDIVESSAKLCMWLRRFP